MTEPTAVIVGAGIGGLATAQALRRQGWRVRVYERAEHLEPVGAGVGIAPNAVKALRHLGLDAELTAAGRPQSGLAIRSRRGRHLVGVAASGIEKRYGAPFFALHRSRLNEVLRTRLDPSTFIPGHEAVRVDPAGTVTFVTDRGEVEESADLVVAADGVNSRTRTALFPRYPGPDYAGYTVWRGIVPAPAAAGLRVPPVLSETWGRGARFGIAAIDAGRIYWFGCEYQPEHTRPPNDLGALAKRFSDWHEPIPALLSSTPEETLLRHDVYYLRARLPGYVRGRVALLGDAAHAVTPDIGQGACLAIEDAVVLAETVTALGVERGLRCYDRLRRPRTQRMARTSGRLGRLLQTRGALAAGARDAIATVLPSRLLMRGAGSAFAWEPSEHSLGVGRD